MIVLPLKILLIPVEILRMQRQNIICTTQYTKWNFLPLNIFKQLHRLFNLYFISLCIYNYIPQGKPIPKSVTRTRRSVIQICDQKSVTQIHYSNPLIDSVTQNSLTRIYFRTLLPSPLPIPLSESVSNSLTRICYSIRYPNSSPNPLPKIPYPSSIILYPFP